MPMVAMVVLLDLCFPSPHLAASMVIDRPEAIDGAPRRGRSVSGGWQPSDFLVSRGMTAQPAGEESRSAPLRHRRSRRQPSFGQINPSKRPFGALGPNRADIKENVAICESTERVGATESNGDELSLLQVDGSPLPRSRIGWTPR
ncbi:bll1949 [Bradyrhizobium diazoefficiens USDA 110]|uniref:Bll1949 protein n=1 Tax=Bradyrhizobium diazoefficiens (strain JCM 10833 / BCRC 13528 / IAM 13628 / NBRC 14792 / USDA 110) TaxID=224911 RepID=Q89TJ1_BRADU|nr:hypothetical protein Bdiaspc4_09905 [Bradyrhizobium diazoefficiens]BAC47214.1 bll1949 [Bradyrhizobium diazoefficiens USDA 110]